MVGGTGWKLPSPQTISCSLHNHYIAYAKVDALGVIQTKLVLDSGQHGSWDWKNGGGTSTLDVDTLLVMATVTGLTMERTQRSAADAPADEYCVANWAY